MSDEVKVPPDNEPTLIKKRQYLNLHPDLIKPDGTVRRYSDAAKAACREMWLDGLPFSLIHERTGVSVAAITNWCYKGNWQKMREARYQEAMPMVNQVSFYHESKMNMPAEMETARSLGIQRQLKLVREFDIITQKASGVLNKIATALDTYDAAEFAFNPDPERGKAVANGAQESLSALCRDLSSLAKTVKASNDVLARLTGIPLADGAAASRDRATGAPIIKNAYFQVGVKPLGVAMPAPSEAAIGDAAIEGDFSMTTKASEQ